MAVGLVMNHLNLLTDRENARVVDTAGTTPIGVRTAGTDRLSFVKTISRRSEGRDDIATLFHLFVCWKIRV